MKDVREILIEKQAELDRLKKEVDSLRMVAPLLDEDGAESEAQQRTQAHAVGAESHSAPDPQPQDEARPGPKPPQSADADKLFSSVEKADTGFWRLGRRRKHG